MPDDRHYPSPHRLLGGLSIEEFLADYWQQKPLLIKHAMSVEKFALTPEELAGLSCEEGVNSRLVQERQGNWLVTHGPLGEEDYDFLPDSHWTVLVTDVEKHIPELSWLLKPFEFVPHWRVDDLMISYAAPQGSVGPHVDAYDVFLLQLEGYRRWQISTSPVTEDNRLPNCELDILQNFVTEKDWVLEPGDMLYLPPGVAHYGVAQDACMTASIGFRAPSYSELLQSLLDDKVLALKETQRYADPKLCYQENPGEIDPETVMRLRNLFQSLLHFNDRQLLSWFGRLVTEPKFEQHHDPIAINLGELLAMPLLQVSPFTRIAFSTIEDKLHFFVDGECHPLPITLLEPVTELCNSQHFDMKKWRHQIRHTFLAEILLSMYRARQIEKSV